MYANQLDKNIAFNLKRVRKSRNMSLDMMAEMTGVSKSMLGQIERGESNPTVTTIGKIVDGIHIPFEELLYLKEEDVTVIDGDELPVYKEKTGAYCFKVVFPYDRQRRFEVFSGRIEPGKICESGSHGEKTCEYVTVSHGRLLLKVGERSYEVGENQAIRFDSDQDHSYQNAGEDVLMLNLVLSHENAGVF